MQYIQFEKTDHINLIKNFMPIAHVYPSANRRTYIAKMEMYYLSETVLLTEIRGDLKYLKRLLAEDSTLDNAENLKTVIAILEKYVKLNEENL